MCKDSINDLKLLGHIRGILQDFIANGLDYLLACAYSRRMRESGLPPLSEFAGIDVAAALELQYRRGVESSELQAGDETLAVARVLANFGENDSCLHMLEKFNDVRSDRYKRLDVILQLGSNISILRG